MGKDRHLDSFLRDVPIETTSQDLLIAYLSVTFDRKDKIPYRNKFYNQVETELKRRGEYEKDKSVLFNLK